MSQLTPYKKYTETELGWIKKIPAHWEIKRNGAIFVQRNETNRSDLPILEVSLRTGVRIRNFDSSKRKQVMSDLTKYKFAAKNDLAYNMMRMWQGAVGIAPTDGLVSPAYVVARPLQNVIPNYYSYLFRTNLYMREVDAFSRGIVKDRNRLYWDQFKQMPSLVPPIEEQKNIVKYLNFTINKIEKLIFDKRKVISLLEEQMASLIHDSILKGHNHTSFKKSDIPFVGNIPSHWSVFKLGKIVQLIVSNVDKHSKVNEIPVRLCNYTDVYKNHFIVQNLDFMPATATPEEIFKYRIKDGDVLITKDSEDWSDIGVPSLVKYEAEDLLCGYHLAILRPKNEKVIGEFLFRVLQDNLISAQFHVKAKGVTRYGLSHGAIKDLIIPIPPIEEQKKICFELSKGLEKFEYAIGAIKKEIHLMHELKDRLILDAVTGNVDVGMAANELSSIENDVESLDAVKFSQEDEEVMEELNEN